MVPGWVQGYFDMLGRSFTGQFFSCAAARAETSLCALHWADLFLYGCTGSQCNGQTSVAGAVVVFNGKAFSYGVTTSKATIKPHADGDYLALFTNGKFLTLALLQCCSKLSVVDQCTYLYPFTCIGTGMENAEVVGSRNS
jgi:hypothetical protein